MYGHCPICGKRYGTMDGMNFTYCKHIKEEHKKMQIKWSREGEKGTAYRRRFPDSSYHKIVTKKAKFFGQLMYAILIAGGAPGWFRPYNLRNVPIEDLLDSLLSNDVNFHITYDGPKRNKKLDFYSVYHYVNSCNDKPILKHQIVEAFSRVNALKIFLKKYYSQPIGMRVNTTPPTISNVSKMEYIK